MQPRKKDAALGEPAVHPTMISLIHQFPENMLSPWGGFFWSGSDTAIAAAGEKVDEMYTTILRHPIRGECDEEKKREKKRKQQ